VRTVPAFHGMDRETVAESAARDLQRSAQGTFCAQEFFVRVEGLVDRTQVLAEGREALVLTRRRVLHGRCAFSHSSSGVRASRSGGTS